MKLSIWFVFLCSLFTSCTTIIPEKDRLNKTFRFQRCMIFENLNRPKDLEYTDLFVIGAIQITPTEIKIAQLEDEYFTTFLERFKSVKVLKVIREKRRRPYNGPAFFRFQYKTTGMLDHIEIETDLQNNITSVGYEFSDGSVSFVKAETPL